VLTSHHYNAEHNHKVNMANSSFEDVTRFRHLGTTVTDQNLIHEEIKNRINSDNACYHSFQNIFVSRLLSKNEKIQTCKTLIFPVVLYGVKLGLFDIK
jgi:hypothetical protein